MSGTARTLRSLSACTLACTSPSSPAASIATTGSPRLDGAPRDRLRERAAARRRDRAREVARGARDEPAVGRAQEEQAALDARSRAPACRGPARARGAGGRACRERGRWSRARRSARAKRLAVGYLDANAAPPRERAHALAQLAGSERENLSGGFGVGSRKGAVRVAVAELRGQLRGGGERRTSAAMGAPGPRCAASPVPPTRRAPCRSGEEALGARRPPLEARGDQRLFAGRGAVAPADRVRGDVVRRVSQETREGAEAIFVAGARGAARAQERGVRGARRISAGRIPGRHDVGDGPNA